MRVYNLTDSVLDYRGKQLAPNGGSDNFPELDSFIPDRDRLLSSRKKISFGSLPSWFLAKKSQEKQAKKVPTGKTPSLVARPGPVIVTPVRNPPAGFAADPLRHADRLEDEGKTEDAAKIREAVGPVDKKTRGR